MANEGTENQMRVASEGLARIEQGIVYRDPAFFEQANTVILQMNQSQRDYVEAEMVRSGILPQATVQVLSSERLNQRIDADSNGQLSTREVDNFLLRETRNPSNRRNFVEEMILNQVAQRNSDRTIRLDDLPAVEQRLRMITGYEQAMREYDGVSRLIGQRYPNQVNQSNNRFEISAAEKALEDDAKNSFLNPEQRKALNFMVANRDDLYRTRLGVGTLFGLATQYFDQNELERNAARFGVSRETVENFDRVQRSAMENLSGVLQNTEYQVQRGQTITDVAIANLRERNGRAPGEQEVSQHVERIARTNNLAQPFRISSGQILKIPGLASSDSNQTPLIPAAPPFSGRRQV